MSDNITIKARTILVKIKDNLCYTYTILFFVPFKLKTIKFLIETVLKYVCSFIVM